MSWVGMRRVVRPGIGIVTLFVSLFGGSAPSVSSTPLTASAGAFSFAGRAGRVAVPPAGPMAVTELTRDNPLPESGPVRVCASRGHEEPEERQTT